MYRPREVPYCEYQGKLLIGVSAAWTHNWSCMTITFHLPKQTPKLKVVGL